MKRNYKFWKISVFFLMLILIDLMFSLSSGCKKEPPSLVVTTGEIRNAGYTSAVSGGNVSYDGNTAVTGRGICWSKEKVPTIADSKTTDSSGTGSFVSNLTGLSPNNHYYFRAYATNGAGTSYGAVKSFQTLKDSVTDIDGNVYHTVAIGNQEWITENLRVTHYNDGSQIHYDL